MISTKSFRFLLSFRMYNSTSARGVSCPRRSQCASNCKSIYNSFTDEADIGATSHNSGPGVHDGEAERDKQRHHLPSSGQGHSKASHQGAQRK